MVAARRRRNAAHTSDDGSARPESSTQRGLPLSAAGLHKVEQNGYGRNRSTSVCLPSSTTTRARPARQSSAGPLRARRTPGRTPRWNCETNATKGLSPEKTRCVARGALAGRRRGGRWPRLSAPAPTDIDAIDTVSTVLARRGQGNHDRPQRPLSQLVNLRPR